MVELREPTGWVIIPLGETQPNKYLRTFFVQVRSVCMTALPRATINGSGFRHTPVTYLPVPILLHPHLSNGASMQPMHMSSMAQLLPGGHFGVEGAFLQVVAAVETGMSHGGSAYVCCWPWLPACNGAFGCFRFYGNTLSELAGAWVCGLLADSSAG